MDFSSIVLKPGLVSRFQKRTDGWFGCAIRRRQARLVASRPRSDGSALRSGRISRKQELGPQPRFVIPQAKPAAVKARDRIDQGEAEAGAFGRAAGIEPSETASCLLAPGLGNAGATVGNYQDNASGAPAYRQVDDLARC